MRKLLAIIFLLFISSNSQAQEIIVSAAYAYKSPISELIRLYESRSGNKVIVNLGTSVHLMNQIRAKAPVDVFFSAGVKEMEELLKEGLIIRDSYQKFLSSRLSVAVNRSDKKYNKIASLRELLKPEFKTIAVGNSKTMPLGRYTEESLMFYNLLEPLKNKLIYVENFQQAIDFLVRKEVDAAIIFSHELVARKTEISEIYQIDESSHSKILYAVGITSYSQNKAKALEFLKITLSKESMEIFKKYGFRMPKGGSYGHDK